jgi:hypothetical protein
MQQTKALEPGLKLSADWHSAGGLRLQMASHAVRMNLNNCGLLLILCCDRSTVAYSVLATVTRPYAASLEFRVWVTAVEAAASVLGGPKHVQNEVAVQSSIRPTDHTVGTYWHDSKAAC